ncbi:hypothetical protein M8494_21470 [Serratia ureilytica]
MRRNGGCCRCCWTKYAASRAPLQLPLPQDARLLNIARALLNDPASPRSRRDWAIGPGSARAP